MTTYPPHTPSVGAEGVGIAMLGVSDFDGTQARTFEPTPDGIGVNEAYRLAIGTVMGERALATYIRSGEHRSRTASEIVASLAGATSPELFEAAARKVSEGESIDDIHHDLVRIHGHHYDGLFSPTREQVRALTDVVIEAKLKPLRKQIGQAMPEGQGYWPRPTAGFIPFSRAVSEQKIARNIQTGVITAGYRDFIFRVYELYEIDRPDLFISDIEIQDMFPDLSSEERAKPNTLPMDIIQERWRHNLGAEAPDQTMLGDRIGYIGDDEVRDGGLAANSGVHFFNESDPDSNQTWQDFARFLGIEIEPADWKEQ